MDRTPTEQALHNALILSATLRAHGEERLALRYGHYATELFAQAVAERLTLAGRIDTVRVYGRRVHAQWSDDYDRAPLVELRINDTRHQVSCLPGVTSQRHWVNGVAVGMIHAAEPSDPAALAETVLMHLVPVNH